MIEGIGTRRDDRRIARLAAMMAALKGVDHSEDKFMFDVEACEKHARESKHVKPSLSDTRAVLSALAAQHSRR